MFPIIGDVVIRTNGSDLTIDAALDDVRHYGIVNNLNVIAVNSLNCYHECGTLVNLESFGTGLFKVEEGAKLCQSVEEITTIVGEEKFAQKGNVEQYEQESPLEPERIEVTSANYQTIFEDNLDKEFFILLENIELSDTLYINGKESNLRKINIDLNGKTISMPDTIVDKSIFDCSYCNLKIKNGSLNNSSATDEGDVYAVTGGKFSLTAINVNFGGATPTKIGGIYSEIVLDIRECDLNGGYISAASTTVTFNCEGQFKVCTPGFGAPFFEPDICAGEDYTIESDSEWHVCPDVDMEVYKTYTIGKK